MPDSVVVFGYIWAPSNGRQAPRYHTVVEERPEEYRSRTGCGLLLAGTVMREEPGWAKRCRRCPR